MIILPGPAIIVIPIGLGVLATEFIWARRLLKKVKQQIVKYTRNKQDNKSLH
jgi:tellurite resistance protein TerC